MAYDSVNQQLVVFGGATTTGGAATDVLTYLFDVNLNQWSASNAPGPPGRYAAAMAYDPIREVVVLFGGAQMAAPLTDTWEYDGTAGLGWAAPTPSDCGRGGSFRSPVWW